MRVGGWSSLFLVFFRGLGGRGNLLLFSGFFGISSDKELDVARKAPMLLLAAFQGISEKLARHRNRPLFRFVACCIFHTDEAESMNNDAWGQDLIFTFSCFFSYSV
jgi:hypothetical protein